MTELETGFVLWQASNLWQRQMRAALDPLALTHVQFCLLRGLAELADSGQPVNQNQLAAYAGTDKMMTSKVLRTLEGRKLVVRQTNQIDSRSVKLGLTHEGQRLLELARPAVAGAEELVFGVLGKKREKFRKHLTSLMEEQAA